MSPRRLLAPWLAAIGALSVSVALAPDARAYCRSTTCVGDCPTDENGCKTTGEKLAWPGVCVGFSIQKDGSEHIPFDEYKIIVEDSFAAWADIDCGGGELASIGIAELDDVSCHKAEYDAGGPNANIILVQDTKWDYHGPFDTLAKTTVTYDTKTGEIFDADIEINHAYNEITTGDANVVYDLRSILTHEIGHFLGLDHTSDPAATMYADYEPGSTEQRSLEDDDLAALCDAYPPGRPGVCDATPRGGLADLCKGETPDGEDGGGCAIAPPTPVIDAAPWALALLFTTALLRRRRTVRKDARKHP